MIPIFLGRIYVNTKQILGHRVNITNVMSQRKSKSKVAVEVGLEPTRGDSASDKSDCSQVVYP